MLSGKMEFNHMLKSLMAVMMAAQVTGSPARSVLATRDAGNASIWHRIHIRPSMASVLRSKSPMPLRTRGPLRWKLDE